MINYSSLEEGCQKVRLRVCCKCDSHTQCAVTTVMNFPGISFWDRHQETCGRNVDTCSQWRLPCQTLSPASHSYGPTSFQYYCQVAVCCLVEDFFIFYPSLISAFKWMTFAVFDFSWPLSVSSSMTVCIYQVWRLCSWSTSLLLCCNALQLVDQFALLLCFTASGPICFVAMLYSLWANLLCCYAL